MLEPIRRLLNEASSSKGTKAFWQAAARILSEWARGAGWLLAAPERELLLRYTLQSLLSLVDAQGAYAALRDGEGEMLRVAATVGHSVEFEGFEIGLTTSTTGRVVRTGDALLTQNILAEPDCSPALSPSGTARAAMIAPLRTAGGVQGAVGVVRYLRPDAEEPPPFGLVDLQYFTAVAAYIAGGLELSEAVSGAHAAAERARAMGGGSPLPLALVGGGGRGGRGHTGGGGGLSGA